MTDVTETGATGVTSTNETPEEKANRLEAELLAERKKTKDQNSYITKLEGQRTSQSVQLNPTTNPAPSAGNSASMSAAEKYAIGKATEEEVEKALIRAKEMLGEEGAGLIAEEVRVLARANIKDPFSVPAGIHDRIVEAAVGRAIANPEKRIIIAGAIAKKPAETPQTVTQTVVVESPASSKVGTMQPGDNQQLGTQSIVQPTGTKPVSPREFFKNVRERK